jgi:CarD family transcriptional regulator
MTTAKKKSASEPKKAPRKSAAKSPAAKKTSSKSASASKSAKNSAGAKSSSSKAAAKTPAKTVQKKVAAKVARAKPAAKPVVAPVQVVPTPLKKLDFRPGDFVVYPTHGVGQIEKVDIQHVAGVTLELFVITFEKEKMILRVPTAKARIVGMRKLSSPDVVANAINTLKGRARIKRTMWSRRAQEYEAKINSGDLVSIAEVVRDLHRAGGQPEQSYSERQLYEAALARMAREVAAIERIDEEAGVGRVEAALLKKAAAAAAAA